MVWQWANNVTSLSISSHVWSNTRLSKGWNEMIHVNTVKGYVPARARLGDILLCPGVECTQIRGTLEGMEGRIVAPNIAAS